MRPKHPTAPGGSVSAATEVPTRPGTAQVKGAPRGVVLVDTPVTDPAIIEAIEAAFMLSVYEAQRLARRRLLGLDPPPRPNPAALAALRDERSRQGAPRESTGGR